MSPEQKKPPGRSTIITTFVGLESLLKKYLRRYLIRQQDIEDVVQDVFVRAYESEKKQEIRSPKSYLFRTAKHIALNELTRKSHQLMVYMGDMSDLDVIDSKLSGDDALVMEQRLTALNKVIANLPPQCQRVLVMRKIYGFSHKEVAKELNISVKTVEKHLTKGLQRCQGYEKSNAEAPGRDVSDMKVRGGARRNSARIG
jgi:RNA polymerase sigma factor (sigma-70 family)